ncbi:activating transcription factor 7-interacting protein 2 isoform X3 [Microcebus murinus]|uniref:activating transcription factor 7-interacting protein 2 isoform X3 n=1 Tax=Microcebus murinus TaxID=30608 RepID=UPI003F6BA820
MASPDKSKRKILKAKKTMPTSCRKQAEMLNKSKNVEALKITAIGSNVPNNNQNLSAGVITSKCRHSENIASSLDSNKNLVFLQKSKAFPQNLIKPVEEMVNSETRLEYVAKQVVCPSKIIDSPSKLFIQEAKVSQNTSENHFEYQANVTRSFFEHEGAYNLNSICSQPSILSDIIQMLKSTGTNTLDDKKIDKMASHLETNSNSESHDKRQSDILSSDSNFMSGEKTPILVNLINSNNCAADVLKNEDSSRTCHSSISNCESTDLKRQLTPDADNSHYQKKRMFSENKENVKRMKTSEQINENISVALERQTALLEQVRHLIRQEICSINYKLFDNKLKELKERIGNTQCRNKHEAIADELFAKIAKLQRRIKTVILSQRNCLKPNMLSSNTTCEVVNSETVILNKNPESVNIAVERMTSVNSEPSEKASEKINLSLDRDESVSESNNDDVMLISVESPNLTTSITSDPTDIRKIMSGNSSDPPNAETEVTAVQKKLVSVIDLTREGLSNYNTEHPVSTLESPSKAVLNSKETTLATQNAAQVLI